MQKQMDDYRTPQYKEFKLKVHQNNNFTCQSCHRRLGGYNGAPDCHHLEYSHGNRRWEYPLTSAVTLCRECHNKVTDLIARVRKCAHEKRVSRAMDLLLQIVDHRLEQDAIIILGDLISHKIKIKKVDFDSAPAGVIHLPIQAELDLKAA